MSSRSITINLTNRVPSSNLVFGNPTAQVGSLPHANQEEVTQSKTLIVSASNSSGGCTGGFSLSNGTAYFGVSYNHPSGPGSTTISVNASPGYLAEANATTFPGHDSIVNLNLYCGIPANACWAVPLELLTDSLRNNSQDFVNSLFAPNMRSATVITDAYGKVASGGYILPADFTGDQMTGFTSLWTQHWVTSVSPACPPQDAALIDLLARYIATASSSGPLNLWIPQISYVIGSNPAIYNLTGYRQYAFMNGAKWNEDTVSTFLILLASGAHFVAISANADLPCGVSMTSFDQFLKSSSLIIHQDIGNSHYTDLINITGTYYLNIRDNFAPENCGLILAFLAGQTINNPMAQAGSYNMFIQLEGWQAGYSRHNADYETYKKTLWNISTFGACPFSEKRATTVFLAPPGWIPQVYQITRMMPYVGAYANSNGTPQAWLNTSMVNIPEDAQTLPSQYYN